MLRQYFHYTYLANKASALIPTKEIYRLNLRAKHGPLYVITITLAILSLCLLVKYVTVGSSYTEEQMTMLVKGKTESAF
jgi:hypothetical protein